MNPIALCMDLLLAMLLTAALAVGFRLNRRLEALKASHADFAKAVSELDAAALKADNALKGLRVASEEAHDALLSRIETARSLILKLEKASEDAAKAAARADQAAARAPAPPAAGRGSRLADLRQDYRSGVRPDLRSEAVGVADPPAPPPIARAERGARVRSSPAADILADASPRSARPDDRTAPRPPSWDVRSDPRLVRPPSAGSAGPTPDRPAVRQAEPALPPRRRAAADDELFDAVADGVRPGLAGLMRLSLARRP